MGTQFHFPAKIRRPAPVILAILLISNSVAQEVPKRPPRERPTPFIPPEEVATPVPPPNLKDFDVWAPSPDLNGFLLNPKWGRHLRDGTLPFPEEVCPMGSTDPGEWSSPRWPNCTSVPVSFNRWEIAGVGACHHVNFMPVTYEGTVWWDGTMDQAIWIAGDYDYTFNLSRDDKALYMRGYDALHIEFDARETVNLWDKDKRTWWELFHHNGVDRGDYQAKAMVDGRHAVVIGLLGLDAPHKGKPELHPVYAMFVRVKERWLPGERRVKEASWAFFVRNWGNEGYCGYDRMDVDTQVIKVQLPPPTVTMDYSIRRGARNADNLASMGVTAEPNPDGMLLTFTLLPAEKESWFMGDLIFRGPAPIIARGAEEGTSHRLPPRLPNEPEEKVPPQLEPIRAQIEKLPVGARKELIAQLDGAVPVRRGKQESARVVIAAPTGARATHLTAPRVVGHNNLVRPKRDAATESEQRKKLAVLRKFFAARGIQLDLPPER